MVKSLLRNNLSLLLFLIVGCTQRIDINNHFDKTASFTVLISDTTNKNTASFEVTTSSPKHARIVNWLKDNQNGWQTAAASYVGDIMIKQNKFALLRLKNKGVMISFSDKEGKHLQYTKECDKEELEFLKHP
jgi:hypothetical protein